MRYLTIFLGLLCLLASGCGKADDTNVVEERAKNLKKKMQTTVEKVKKGMADRTKERAREAGVDVGDSEEADESDDSDQDGND